MKDGVPSVGMRALAAENDAEVPLLELSAMAAEFAGASLWPEGVTVDAETEAQAERLWYQAGRFRARIAELRNGAGSA
jgi:hypothetical protein